MGWPSVSTRLMRSVRAMRRLRFFIRNYRNFYLINREVYTLRPLAAMRDASRLARRMTPDPRWRDYEYKVSE